MVISNTKAVDVNIQAVSPALILSELTNTGSVGPAGAAAGAAAGEPSAAAAVDAAVVGAAVVGAAVVGAADAADAGASSAQTTGIASVKDAHRTNRDSMDISESPSY
jgi:hypothetical protein